MSAAAPLSPVSGFAASPLADELLRDPAIERALAAVRGHLDVEIAFIARYVDGGQRELTHVHSDLTLPIGPGFREPVEDSYCWHVLEGRLPALIRDVAEHPLTLSLAMTDFLPVGCHLGVPLHLPDGKVWGSFCAVGLQPDQTLCERDMKVVRAFAAMAAQRIEEITHTSTELAATRQRVSEMLDGHAITIFQQPIHSLASGDPVGVECLARFPNNRQRGPHTWFEDAERAGLGVELEIAAVRNALETLAHVPAGKYATVNVSPATVLSGQLEQVLAEAETDKLVLEVTEHQRVADFAVLAERLSHLQKTVRIAIDDVGTGYSGLRHIADLKPDMLKMDMALTRDIHKDPARRALTGALVQLSRDIGCKLVAGGIETVEECAAMAALGVDFGQGYYFARPLPVVAAVRHLMGLGERDDAPDIAPHEMRPMPTAAHHSGLADD
jgi:EAL domain-containing protein (putative c-di-GMP-specific phosphodiesterase class I)